MAQPARATKYSRSAPTSASATPAITQRAPRVRNATAPPPLSSSSALKDTNKKRASTLYKARAIIGEEGSRYLIDWEGIDPATGTPYTPTWEPKGNANPALKREWEGKKTKDRVEQTRAGLPKAQANNARNGPARKDTASNRSSRQQEWVTSKDRQTQTRSRSSAQDSQHKPDASHKTQQNRLREPSGRNLKRKRGPNGVADGAKPESATTRPQPQPNNKKQRRQSAKPLSESPSEQIFPARAITGERPRQYRVAWEKDAVTGEEFEDTWEPKSYVSQDLVAAWRQQQKGKSQKAPTKQKNQPAVDKEQQEEPDDNVYSAKAIVAERKRQYLVAWENDPKTGEKFEDTWEPKGNVSQDLVAEWRQQDMKRSEETPKQPEETPKQPDEPPKQPEATPKQLEATPKRLKEPAQKPPEESPATAGLSKMVNEVLREEEQNQHSLSLPIGPVTPPRDEDEHEEDEETSYTPSSTMLHTAITLGTHTTAD